MAEPAVACDLGGMAAGDGAAGHDGYDGPPHSDTGSTMPHPRHLAGVLRKWRNYHEELAHAHRQAANHYDRLHLITNVIIMSLTVVGTMIQRVLITAGSSWSALVNELTLSLVGGLTAVNSFLKLPSRSQQHSQMGDSYAEFVDRIDVSLARIRDEPHLLSEAEVEKIFRELVQVRASLQKGAVRLPWRISQHFDEIRVLRNTAQLAEDRRRSASLII